MRDMIWAALVQIVMVTSMKHKILKNAFFMDPHTSKPAPGSLLTLQCITTEGAIVYRHGRYMVATHGGWFEVKGLVGDAEDVVGWSDTIYNL